MGKRGGKGEGRGKTCIGPQYLGIDFPHFQILDTPLFVQQKILHSTANFGVTASRLKCQT
jgi:hypothetical protein